MTTSKTGHDLIKHFYDHPTAPRSLRERCELLGLSNIKAEALLSRPAMTMLRLGIDHDGLAWVDIRFYPSTFDRFIEESDVLDKTLLTTDLSP